MRKERIKKIVGSKNFTKVGDLYRLIMKTNLYKHVDFVRNFMYDLRLYYKHSTVFKINSYEKLESEIILKYHTIEKGLLHSKTKFRFGKKNIIGLNKLLEHVEIQKNHKNTQIQAAYIALCEYYDKHLNNNIDISDFFSVKLYNKYRDRIKIGLSSTINNSVEDYFDTSTKDFYEFSFSRSSVRNFTGEKISISLIKKVVKLASNAPSVCNRQSSRVYHIDDKLTIDDIIKLQGGMTGFSKNINQLLIVVSDRNYFFSIGERNQLFIDGGIFLLNLLYALHYYEVGACPANWGKQMEADKSIKKLLSLKESEKVICLVPIGVPEANFKTCTSLRRDLKEILITK